MHSLKAFPAIVHRQEDHEKSKQPIENHLNRCWASHATMLRGEGASRHFDGRDNIHKSVKPQSSVVRSHYILSLLFRFIFEPALVAAGNSFPPETPMKKKPYLRPAKEFTIDKKALVGIGEALDHHSIKSQTTQEVAIDANFERVANRIYTKLGRPERNVKNGWKIWEAMYLDIDLARPEIWDTSSLDGMDDSW